MMKRRENYTNSPKCVIFEKLPKDLIKFNQKYLHNVKNREFNIYRELQKLVLLA